MSNSSSVMAMSTVYADMCPLMDIRWIRFRLPRAAIVAEKDTSEHSERTEMSGIWEISGNFPLQGFVFEPVAIKGNFRKSPGEKEDIQERNF